MHTKQVLSPVHEICRFLWIPKAKKLFVRASSREARARHLCRRFHSEIVRTKAFPRYRHLPNLSVCDSRRSPASASLLSLFRGSDVKAFETQMVGQKVEWTSVPGVKASFEKGRLKTCSLYKCLHLQCLINTQPL